MEPLLLSYLFKLVVVLLVKSFLKIVELLLLVLLKLLLLLFISLGLANGESPIV